MFGNKSAQSHTRQLCDSLTHPQQDGGLQELQPRNLRQVNGVRTPRLGSGIDGDGMSGESRDANHNVETFIKKSDRMADAKALSAKPTCLSQAVAIVKAERDAYARRTASDRHPA